MLSRRPPAPSPRLPAWLKVGLAVAVVSVVFGGYRMWAAGARSCESQPDAHERDNCLSERLLTRAPAELDAVTADAVAIDDPLIRSAAILAWVDTHGDQLAPGVAPSLCRYAGEFAGKCRAELQAGHLRKP